MIVKSNCETGETRYTACVNGAPYNTMFKNERGEDDTEGDIHNLFEYISSITKCIDFDLDDFSLDDFEESRFKKEDMQIIQSSDYLKAWREKK